MKRALGGCFRTIRAVCAKFSVKMSGVSRDAPIGIQCIQRLSSWMCPRLRVNRLRCYQALVLALTYCTYLTYHLTRKPISVVKNVLHQNCSALVPPPGTDPADPQWCNWAPFNTDEANTLLGALDSAFLFSYAAAMFVSGMVAERVDLRYFLSLGMLVSAVFCYLFGVGRTYAVHSMPYYILVQAGAGVAQTTGWPGTVAVMSNWFGDGNRGLIFGLWNSHTSLGNILGTLMAAQYVETDWALSFIYPALVMGAVGAAVCALLPPEPRAVGLHVGAVGGVGAVGRESPRTPRRSLQEDAPTQVVVGDQAASLRPARHSTNTQEEEAGERTALLAPPPAPAGGPPPAISLARALAIPGVAEFSLSLFFAKLVSYTFLYWLPKYIQTSTSLSPRQAGDLSTVFDVGGAVGAALAGYLSDAAGRAALVCVGFYALAGPALMAYQAWGAASYGANVALLALGGALVNGPYALITTAVSAELGTHSSLAGNTRALATVTAIIDGTGSIGAALGPMLAGVLSAHGSWPRVFYVLILCNYLALFLLIRIAAQEFKKWRQERRLASPRLVRVE